MCHVLIIEDKPFIAMDIEDLLASAGATSFDIVATQADAISAAMAHEPDVITSDVSLIEGTGPAAVRVIHKALGEIPVIFITGTPEDCDPCDPPGVILGKPLDRCAIAAAFRSASASDHSN